MSHCKNSVRDIAIGKRWIFSDSERTTLHRVWAITEESAVAMEVSGQVISYANEGDDHPNNWGTIHSSIF